MDRYGVEAGRSSARMYVYHLPLTCISSSVDVLISLQCAKSRDDDLNITESHFTHLSQKLGADDKAVSLLGLFDRYQLDVATHIFFGKSTDSLTSFEQPFRRAIARLLTVASYKLSFGLDTSDSFH